MRDMIDRGIVSAEKTEALLEAACAVWANSPDSAREIFVSLGQAPSPNQAADLMDVIDWDDADTVAILSEVWAHISANQDQVQRVSTTDLVLAKGPAKSTAKPDAALEFWLDATEDRRQLLEDALRSDETNDNGRRRLWFQALRFVNDLGRDFYQRNVAYLLKRPDNEETARAVLESGRDLAPLFQNADERAKLAEVLLADIFQNAPSTTVQTGVAAWAKWLDGSAALRKMDPTALTSEAVDVLENQFGKSATKHLRKAVEKHN